MRRGTSNDHAARRRVRGVQDTETGMPRGAQCAFKDLMSHSSAIRITYRISLRSSSLQEPRYPLLKVVISLLVLADWGVCTPSILEFSLTTGVGVFGVCLGGRERQREKEGARERGEGAFALSQRLSTLNSLNNSLNSRLSRMRKGGESCLAARPDGPLAPRGHRVCGFTGLGWVRAAPAAEAAARGPWVIASPRPRRHVKATLQLWVRGNDPSAGSPTETLLRLHLPLDGKV